MSSGTSEILQEYLIKLGYQVDALSNSKFDEHLSKTTKNLLKTGGAVLGVVASVEAAAVAFAYSMRKMYFQSELANDTVKNLKGMEFAGKQIGVTGEAMSSAIHNMAQAFRLNPGLQGLVESFGIKVTGRTTTDVMIDYLKVLSKMPEYQGARFAAMFGMDADTYHQITTHMDEVISKRNDMLNLYKQSGVDPDAAKKAILEYTSSLDLLEARLEILGQAVLIKLQPFFKKTTDFINNSISGWTDIVTNKAGIVIDSDTPKNIFGFLKETLTGGKPITSDPITDYLKELNDKSAEWATKNFAPRGIRNNNPGNLNFAGQAGATKETGKQGRFAVFGNAVQGNAALADQLDRYVAGGVNTIQKIAEKYAPPGENDTKAYVDFLSKRLGISSNKTLDFSKDYQLMKEMMQAIVAREQGASWVNQKDIEAGIRQSKYGKSLRMTENTHLGMGAAGSRAIHITFAPNISVHGTDAKATGDAVAKTQERLYGDVIRNTKGALQ